MASSTTRALAAVLGAHLLAGPAAAQQKEEIAVAPEQYDPKGLGGPEFSLRLDVGWVPPGELDRRDELMQRQAIELAQDTLVRRHPQLQVSHRFQHVPWLRVQVADDPRVLRDIPLIVDIEPIRWSKTHLGKSVPAVGAAWTDDPGAFSGAGRSVAVLDTGFWPWHPFLEHDKGQPKVIAEGCYSDDGWDLDHSWSSTCPAGETQGMLYGDVGLAQCFQCPADEEQHGQHVAGIAVGDNGKIHGVAPGADLVAISAGVLRDDGEIRFGAGVEEALEGLLPHAARLRVASVNMSIGSEEDFSGTACDAVNQVRSDLLATYRSLGIVPVVCAGNEGRDTEISEPACLSSSFAVGAAWFQPDQDWPPGGGQWVRYPDSNVGPNLDLYAPGVSITSSVGTSSYDTMSGTSMAAPHVAGAVAVLREAVPGARARHIENALRASPVILSAAGQDVPFLQLDHALDELQAMVAEGGDQADAAVDVSPDGRIAVAWDDHRGDVVPGIYVMRLDPDGGALAEPILVSDPDDAQVASRPDVAIHDDGRMVVVWEEDWDGDRHYQIFARLVSPDDEVGEQLLLTPVAHWNHYAPQVVLLSDGRWFAAWEVTVDGGYEDPSAAFDIQGALYDVDGDLLWGRYDLSASPLQDTSPDLDVDDHDDVVAVWESGDCSSLCDWTIEGRVIMEDGELAWNSGATFAPGWHHDVFTVPSAPQGNQLRPSVAVGETSFMVAWEHSGADNWRDVRGRMFDLEGLPLDVEFEVASSTEGNQRRPDLDASGNLFWVGWEDDHGTADHRDVVARRFSLTAEGSSETDLVRYQTLADGGVRVVGRRPAVGALPDGRAIVVRQENDLSEDWWRLLGQRVGAYSGAEVELAIE